MYAKLIREPLTPESKAIMGQLLVDGCYVCDTLELLPNREARNLLERYGKGCCVAPGFYRMDLCKSPRFGEVLPLLRNVIGRSDIRIHAGNKVADTRGCILVGTRADGIGQEPRLTGSRKALAQLMQLLLQALNQHEELWLHIEEPDPTAAGYDAVTHGFNL